MDHVPASGGGSCFRCQRSLGLLSVKWNDHWYCTASCAEGGPPSPVVGAPVVAEPALYARPRRYFRSRMPKELRASAVPRVPAGGNGATGTR
ncbi:MAG TPA: hypothetical protein VMS55_00340 [Myxococcota bacterium]|nr:hypothetical protein [Myxococcota bacterium]